jgi:hypothetical protein
MSEASGHRSSRAAQDEVVVGLHGAINRLTTLHGTLRTWFHYERSQQASGIPTFPVWTRLSRGILGSRPRRLVEAGGVGRSVTARGRPAFPRSATIVVSSVTTMLIG